MVVRDGEGNFIDFEWPSFLYFVKAGAAFTIGAAIVAVAWTVFLLLVFSRFPELAVLRMWHIL